MIDIVKVCTMTIVGKLTKVYRVGNAIRANLTKMMMVISNAYAQIAQRNSKVRKLNN